VRGANVDFDFTQAGGKAHLALEQGALDFPGVFEEPVLPFAALEGDVRWQSNNGQIPGQRGPLALQQCGRAGRGGRQLAHQRSGAVSRHAGPARQPEPRRRHAGLALSAGGRSKRARDYVQEAVQAGTASSAKFRVKGDLRQFPFPENKGGEFLISAQVRGVTYAYVPHSQQPNGPAWPALSDLTGELVFQGNGMRIKDIAGKVQGQPRLQVRADADIADFRVNQVQVKGRIKGPLNDALAVVNGSPLAGMTNGALGRASAGGNADVDLRLVLPLQELAHSQVQGSVTLAGNDLQVTPDSPQLAGARGTVNFSERGFQLANVQARALGGDLRLEGGSRPAAAGEPSSVVLRAQGTATAEGLRQAHELGFVARLAHDFTGGTSYALALAIRRGTPEVAVTSSLQGLGINLPAPLNKPADAALPLRYQTALTRESLAPGARLQETLSVELGRLGTVIYVRDLAGPAPQVLRGSIALGLGPGESVTMPAEGVMANVQLGSFNVDAWEDALARISGTETAAPGGTPAPRAEMNGSGSGYLPTLLAVRAKDLSAEGHTLHNVVVGGSRDGRVWRANVDATN
jgi:uncharacterized protein YhdP